MFKILRMICAVASAVLVTASIFAAILADTLIPAFGCAAAAPLLFVLCLPFKYLQEEKEAKENAGKPTPIPFTSKEDAADADTDSDADTDADAAETQTGPTPSSQKKDE